jgi:mannose-6-phosphate isomerase-like protein (cupin superfamily)
MTKKNRPGWSDVTSSAVLKGVNSGHFDWHFHDCNEYWMICAGKAKIWIDGKSYYVREGDIVCIRKGLEHDMLELYEPLVGFHFEDGTPEGKPTGHQHKTEKDAAGHPVATLPLPADFPKD